MNLDRPVKTLLVSTLASISGVGLLMTTATVAQARDMEKPSDRVAHRTSRVVHRISRVLPNAPERPEPERPAPPEPERPAPPPAPPRPERARPPVPSR